MTQPPPQKREKMFLVFWVFQPILEKLLLVKKQLTQVSVLVVRSGTWTSRAVVICNKHRLRKEHLFNYNKDHMKKV